MEVLHRNSSQDLIKECEDKENNENCIINTYLDNIITKEGYINYKVFKKDIYTGGANYFGIPRQIDVKGDTVKGTKETSLFIKLKMPKFQDNFMVDNMFPKEVYIYKDLAKIFTHLQEEANIPIHDRYNIAKSYDESDNNAIILENLTKKGYKVLDRLEVLSLNVIKQSIIHLAKLHGLSFVINKKMPNLLKEKTELFQYPVLYNDEWQAFVKNMFKQDIDNIDSYFQTKISNVLPKVIEKFPKYLSGELASIKCLCHGDYKPSNIMVKEEKGELIDLIAVDFQMAFFGSPVTDFIFFINSGTDRQFRKKHLEHLKDLYHQSLKKFLNYFQIDVDSVYTRKQFEQDLKDYFDYGLCVAISYFPFFFIEDDVPDLAKDSLLDVGVKLGPIFKDRMEGVLQDQIDGGYL